MATLVTIDWPGPGAEPGPAAPLPLPLKVFISYKQNDFAAADTSGGTRHAVGKLPRAIDSVRGER